MMRRFQWAAAVFLLLPEIAAPNTGIIQVTGLRAWSHSGSTRIIIETSGPTEYHADRARNPDRLFFDILHARPWIDRHRVATRLVKDQLVERVRVAETSPGTTRVVFDLNAPVEYEVTTLDTPERIVIELRPAGTKTHSVNTLPTHAPATTVASVSMVSEQPDWTPVSTAPGGIRTSRSFVPPALTRSVRPLIPMPEVPSQLGASAFIPFAMPDSWTSLGSLRTPRRPASEPTAAPASTPSTPASVNTTTRVLPASHLTGAESTAKASTNASLSLTRALGLKINRVVIDAGHGGHDDGTIGPNGVMEKDVVLDVALRLAILVQTRLGAEVVLTRSDDTFVPLTERTAIANEHKADLFLSIHANSSPATSVAGTETFLLNLNSSPGAIAVAARENAGSDKSVGELRDLLQSIAQNDKIAESQSFAADIQSSIFTQAAKSNAAAHDRGVKKAPFVVLIGARMPSALAEIGFLSNAKDESNLNKPDYRQKIAESLYRGIARYSQSLSHFEVADTKAVGYSGTGAK